MNNGQLLHELLSRPISFHPVFSRLSGSATAGLYLSQLYYWTPRASHEDKWIHKSASEFMDETTLTEGEQRSARKALERLGLLESDLAHKHFSSVEPFDRRLCYRLNIDLLSKLVCHVIASETPAVIDLENSQMHVSDSQIESAQTTVHNSTESTYRNHHNTTNGIGSGCDVDELINALVWEYEQAGKKIRSRGGFESKVRAEKEVNGFTPADRATLKAYFDHKKKNQEALERNVQSGRHPATIYSNPETAKAKGDAFLAKARRGLNKKQDTSQRGFSFLGHKPR